MPSASKTSLEALAEHYARSDERAKAVHYLVRAGERAAGLFAYHEAAGYYERALQMLPSEAGVHDQRCTILELLGDAVYAQGERESGTGALAGRLGRT